MDLSWFKGRKVFVTGHTGFKGAWLCEILLMAGAEVTGYALSPEEESLFSLLGLAGKMKSVVGDVRDAGHLFSVMKEAQPEVVLHLAAQPLVRRSYEEPVYTFETNIMGTVNLLEAVRQTPSVRSLVNVTTDKVYLNRETMTPYREGDPLDGYDPYSNSKSCSDLVTHSYWHSFFEKEGPAVSTVRAGNVIGGGDFAKDRIVPDCVRAAMAGNEIILRNPDAIRPFQHVLEPLSAYLLLAWKQAEDKGLSGAYNVGPDTDDAVTVRRIAETFAEEWGDLKVTIRPDGGPHEASLLLLDSTKIRTTLKWQPVWHTEEAVRMCVRWSKIYAAHGDILHETEEEIQQYFK